MNNKKTCEFCGKEYTKGKTESWAKFEERHACSLECSARLRNGQKGVRFERMAEASSRMASVMGYRPITPQRGRHIAEAHSHSTWLGVSPGIQSGFSGVWPDHG